VHKIFLSRDAVEDRIRIFDLLSDYSDEVAERHIMRLDAALEDFQDSIVTSGYFFITGEPYRAKLFRISRRFQAYIRERNDSCVPHLGYSPGSR
jgi:hypothetical protein